MVEAPVGFECLRPIGRHCCVYIGRIKKTSYAFQSFSLLELGLCLYSLNFQQVDKDFYLGGEVCISPTRFGLNSFVHILKIALLKEYYFAAYLGDVCFSYQIIFHKAQVDFVGTLRTVPRHLRQLNTCSRCWKHLQRMLFSQPWIRRNASPTQAWGSNGLVRPIQCKSKSGTVCTIHFCCLEPLPENRISGIDTDLADVPIHACREYVCPSEFARH